jgi:hypothetical protein
VTETTQEISTLQDYLDRLKAELAGSDPALVQDALYDAEGYLRDETAAADSSSAGTAAAQPAVAAADPRAALERAIRRFGTPREVAEAYRETDARVAAALAQPAPRPATSWGQRIFGVFLDPKAYGSLLFMFLSLITGILYFVWAVTGLALSLGLSVLIIGLPFLLLFVSSIRLFALLEGRLVESLLGLRMPRRPQFPRPEGSILARLKRRLTDPRTWSTLLYMILKLPLGILSFVLGITMLAISLSLIVAPFAQIFIDNPEIILVGGRVYEITPLGLPVFWLAGLLDLLATMHLARAIGRIYGSIAKAMLVSA